MTQTDRRLGRECWCGDALQSDLTEVLANECNSHCAGDNSLPCGGGQRISLYLNNNFALPELPAPATLDGFVYQGCYVDPINPRVLGNVFGADDMTPQLCAQHCATSKYIGLEFGKPASWSCDNYY